MQHSDLSVVSLSPCIEVPIAMDFGEALLALKAGGRIARTGWNGKGMWLRYVGASDYQVGCSVPEAQLPWIGLKTADNKMVPWLASQTDVLAEDWCVLP